MSLYFELKRRNVFRVAIAYLALAWLLIEVAGTLFPAFGIPAWAFRFVVIVLAFGFVPVLIFSWAYEITPEGVKREKDVVRDDSITHLTTRRLDGIAIGLIVVALAFILVDRFWLSPRLAEQSAAPAVAVTEQVATEPEASAESDNSIAVLPFVNMSDDAGNEYFSDGLSEELLNLLTRIPELRVVARTSSFSFKGQNLEIPEIAERLKVAHVLEGSVRKAGNRVRITAQLIKADDGYHLWSESYDRTLDDIFAIQDEIAVEVVKQLKVMLLGDAPKVEETDPEAYALYLQGSHLNRQGTDEASAQAQALLQQALAIDPNYVAAWATLANNHLQHAYSGQRSLGEHVSLAREAARQALAFDPEYAPAYAYLGQIEAFYDWDLKAAARNLERALTLEPANPDILIQVGNLLNDLGRLDKAIAVGEHSVDRDPVNPEGHYRLGKSYLWARRPDKAIASFRTVLSLSPGHVFARYRIGVALLLKGDPAAALEEIQRQDQALIKRLEGEVIVYHALGQQSESNAALAVLLEKYTPEVAAYNIAYVLAFRNEADRAFAWLEKALEYNDLGLHQIANQPEFTNIHDDPRWLPFLERLGKSPEQLAAIEFKVTLPE